MSGEHNTGQENLTCVWTIQNLHQNTTQPSEAVGQAVGNLHPLRGCSLNMQPCVYEPPPEMVNGHASGCNGPG